MVEEYMIRRFAPGDVAEVRDVIHRALREVCSKSYPAEIIAEVCDRFSAEHLLKLGAGTHMYVAESVSGRILGTGSIAPYFGSEKESVLLTIYVLPDLIGRGIGSEIVGALEKDEFFLRANRIEVPSALNAVGFYRKMGYDFKDGRETPGDDGLVRLEKTK